MNQDKTLVYYISEYGYGHATRSIAIIRALLDRNESLRMIICHEFAYRFLRDSLDEYGERVIFHKVKTDIGYVLKEATLELNQMKINEMYRQYMELFSDLVSNECKHIQAFSPCGILSDISPLAFAVGETLGIRTVGISNFTWAGACKEVLETDIHKWLLDQYMKADFFYRLAGFDENLDLPYTDVNFFSRKVNIEEVNRLKQKYNIKPNETIVFMAIGMKIELEELSDWSLWDQENCRFILSSNMKVNHPNVIIIPNNYTESQNFVALANVVITKAGWGTVGEAVSNGKKLIIINRDIKEDQNTLAWLRKNYCVEVIEWEELRQFRIKNL